MRSIWLGTLLLVAGVAGAASATAGNVQVRLDATNKSSDAGSGKLAFTVSNESSAPMHLLRWQTPLDGVDSDMFDVQFNGESVSYIGRLVKRPAPQAADYIELKPGEARSVEVDLSSYYDMHQGGQYTVQYRRDAASLVLEAGLAARADVAATLAVDSRSTTLWVDGGANPLDAEMQSTDSIQGVLAATNSFVSCSNTRQTQLATARNSAVTYATNGKSYLDAGTQGARYTWWFGTYVSSRYSTVRTHFTNLKSALSSQPYTFDCSCTDSGTYAYVYPTQPYRVYLCGAFWSAPNTGTDSRAGTLIHESSHFNVVAGTDDWVYGQTGAHKLAGSNPAHAIDNADSHEYFAENTPARN
ncbi:MAG: M35 family metallo-endopeptidase [Dokdonella sp.]